MIKARAGNLVFLGLEAKNLEKLKEGRPMLINLSELGVEGDTKICVFYGETVPDLIQILEEKAGFTVPDIQPQNTKPI